MAMDGQNIAGKRRPSGDGVGDGGSVCKSGRWHQNGAKMRHFAGLLGPHRHPGKRRGFLPAWIFCAKPFFSGFATTVVLFVTIQGQWGRYVCCSLKKFRFSRVHNSEGYHTATAPCLALFCLPGAGGRGGPFHRKQPKPHSSPASGGTYLQSPPGGRGAEKLQPITPQTAHNPREKTSSRGRRFSDKPIRNRQFPLAGIPSSERVAGSFRGRMSRAGWPHPRIFAPTTRECGHQQRRRQGGGVASAAWLDACRA
jgi:hypothetical protein